MGTDVTEVMEILPRPQDIKVHRLMCTKLINLVDRILTIFPEIEASRPRCSSGLKAISSLNEGIKKARLLLEHCSACSKLYLAITGEAILSRCKRSRNLLEQCLSQIQNDVPVLLAAEISCIVSDLRDATFSLDSFEEEVGAVVRSFLQQYASSGEPLEDSVIETLRFAALRLQITSQKALLIEKRSIKKLLDKVGDVEPAKRQILLYLLDLLKKYGQLIVREQTENDSLQHKDYPSLATSCDVSVKVKSGMEIIPDNRITDMKRNIPPEEFKCPISSRLMHDPVVIASGQTFERMWIQKWFDEGHDICPKTKRKLAHSSMTPNVVMKELILRWCRETGNTILDPRIQSEVGSCETSFTSIASLSNSMNALSLPVDFSNISLESLDGYNSDSLQFKTRVSSTLESAQAENESRRFRYCANTHEKSNGFLDKLDELPWESRCKTVEDVKSRFNYDDQVYHSVSLEKFSEPLIRFLRSARDRHDLEAQKTGIQLLLAVVSMGRSSIINLPEEAYSLLASFLDSEVTEEACARKNEVTEVALAILEVLSSHQCCTPKIAASQAPYSILRILETQIRELLEPAIKILYNLSLSKEICSVIMPSEFIPRLVPLFEDMSLAGYCISILKNLCTHPDSRVSVAETDGCIASIAKLLESDSHEDQEHAVYVLLSLCSQRVQYCQLVMDEGVIPSLVSISVNGNKNGKIFAMELLRLLREHYMDPQDCSGPALDLSRDYSNQSTEKKSPSKASGFWGLTISLFQKSKASKKKK